MSSKVDQLGEQSDLEQGIKITRERVMEIPTNRVHEDDKFATDVNMESKDEILKKINIEIDLFQRTTVFSNDLSMWI
ncbi:MAG TPA: hypothetical protein VK566_05970 [Nitrososphaeraceae archaeon]|jgi:hypothetical protein|nr:hypothetical protein [Nitrososphaeraceae archaeon]